MAENKNKEKKTTVTKKGTTTNKTTRAKTTSSKGTKKTITPAKKNSTTKNKTVKKVTPKTTTSKKSTRPNSKSVSSKKKTPTKKKAPIANTATKAKTTSSKGTKVVNKAATNSKRDTKTTLNKKIENKEEPIKIITSSKKIPGKKVESKPKKKSFKEIWLTFLAESKKRFNKVWQLLKTKKIITQNPNKKPFIEIKNRKKWIFYSVLCLLLAILLMIPYGNRSYLSEASNKKIEAPKFMKLKEECCSYTATFSSPRSSWSLKKDMENILKNYELLQCEDKTYYYNSKENYSITEYKIKNGLFFNQLSITYGVGNSCDIDTKFKKLELLPQSFSIEDAKKDGNYVVVGDKVYNKEAYSNFMGDVKNRISTALRIVKTNEYGDVLITDLEYKDGKYIVSYDGTRDRNNKNNHSIEAYIFDNLKVYNNKLYAYNGNKLVVNGKKYNTYYLLDVN